MISYFETQTKEELGFLHESACKILEELGVSIRNDELVKALKNHGVKLDGKNRVMFLKNQVEKAIETAPAKFMVYDRRGSGFMIGEGHHHMNGGTMTQILEYPGFVNRRALLSDVRNLTIICDALDKIDGVVLMVEADDVIHDKKEIISIGTMMKNTTKFCLACPADSSAALAFVKMAKCLDKENELSERPTICLLASSTPGYEIDYHSAKTLMIAANEKVPVVLMGGSIQGAQSPATMAGSFIMKLAENLAMLTIVQILNPGSPVLLNWGQIKLDMRTMEIDESGPENYIAEIVGAQMSRMYKVPSYACPSSDSKTWDFQAGFEMGQGLYNCIISGINVSVNAGTAAKCRQASYELLVIHNEMLKKCERISGGLLLSEERACVNLQIQMGIRADYLGCDHTFEFYKDEKEFMQKDLFDASLGTGPYMDPMVKAKKRVKNILDNHIPAVRSDDIEAIDKIMLL